MFKMSTGVAALFAAGLAVLACSDGSGLNSGGGGAKGGQAGGGGSTGGSGGMIGAGGVGAGGIGAGGTGGTTATGGTTGAGGITAAGGIASMGGTKPTGGTTSAGGITGAAGTVSTGGTVNTGGTKPTGGTTAMGGITRAGGIASAGGTVSAGGSKPTGGTSATGGTTSAGGITSAGGTVSTGGSKPTGGTTTATGGATSTGGTGGVTPCDSNCTSAGFTCCNNACRSFSNDPYNCGQCGNACTSDSPVCQNGKCTALTCTAELGPPGTVCCGQNWCSVGQLCCQQQGPVVLAQPMCLTIADGTCPRGCKMCVCANPDTPIATPGGTRNISELHVGDLVYSVDHDQVVPVPIAAVRQRPAPSHVVPQLLLDNGQVLQISARHPTADNRTFGELRAGDRLGELRIKTVKLVTYQHAFTYDILPASDTGFYFAGGAMIGSTLIGDCNELGSDVPEAPRAMARQMP